MISNNYSIDNINKMKITSKKYYCNDTVSDYHYFSTILFYVSTMYFLSYTNPISTFPKELVMGVLISCVYEVVSKNK